MLARISGGILGLLVMLWLSVSPQVPSRQPRHLTAGDSVRVIEALLRVDGGDRRYAGPVAAAVQVFSAKHHVNSALVVGIIAVEDKTLLPTARNPSGATGIMQVMPHWVRDIRSCGNNLKSIPTNICLGTRVLAIHLKEALHRGLMRYDGCRGSPNCSGYARAVLRRAREAARAGARLGLSPVVVDSLFQETM